MAVEVEDDVFFADLSKQIAMLITDDDDDVGFPVQNPPAHLQGISFHHMPVRAMMPPPPPYMYEMAYRSSESKGTGVFIPRFSGPRKKNRSRGSSSASNGSSQRELNRSGAAVPRAINSDRLQSNLHKN